MFVMILRWRIQRKQKRLAKLNARLKALQEQDPRTVDERISYLNLICKTTMLDQKIKDLQCELDWYDGRYSLEVRDNWKGNRDRR